MNYKNDIESLVDEIATARINAGALFDKYANSGDYDKAIIFQIIRDSLRVNKEALESFIEVNKK